MHAGSCSIYKANVLITGVSALLEFRHRCGSLCLHLERGTVLSCGDDGTGYVAQGEGILTYFWHVFFFLFLINTIGSIADTGVMQYSRSKARQSCGQTGGENCLCLVPRLKKNILIEICKSREIWEKYEVPRKNLT